MLLCALIQASGFLLKLIWIHLHWIQYKNMLMLLVNF